MDITNLQQALETELDFVTTELSKIAAYNQTTGDWEAKPEIEPETSDDNLAADQAESGIERQATAAALETRYRNLKRALAKIAAGTYGVCEISGEPIESARLEANPAARTNIANRDREKELPL